MKHRNFAHKKPAQPVFALLRREIAKYPSSKWDYSFPAAAFLRPCANADVATSPLSAISAGTLGSTII